MKQLSRKFNSLYYVYTKTKFFSIVSFETKSGWSGTCYVAQASNSHALASQVPGLGVCTIMSGLELKKKGK